MNASLVVRCLTGPQARPTNEGIKTILWRHRVDLLVGARQFIQRHLKPPGAAKHASSVNHEHLGECFANIPQQHFAPYPAYPLQIGTNQC